MRRESLPPLLSPLPTSPVHKLSNLFVSIFGKVPINDARKKWSATYSKLLELSQLLEKNETLPGAKVYSTRVYDLVMDNDQNEQKNYTQVLELSSATVNHGCNLRSRTETRLKPSKHGD
ncbi:hypothetical protein KIN20_025206 [Parelaphostrongylus tenuis]|uniref:Uncharacterized protein n=1 Tax=Parelaphostrongylus tenuis TaxID=148309 RepID=A0AAD5N915_PARTN|nr:hypothetical protein KIN20_025206 [Parelaphostrongylus tenuis]